MFLVGLFDSSYGTSKALISRDDLDRRQAQAIHKVRTEGFASLDSSDWAGMNREQSYRKSHPWSIWLFLIGLIAVFCFACRVATLAHKPTPIVLEEGACSEETIGAAPAEEDCGL